MINIQFIRKYEPALCIPLCTCTNGANSAGLPRVARDSVCLFCKGQRKQTVQTWTRRRSNRG